MNNLLRVEQLTKVFEKGGNTIQVLQKLDFQIAEGECVAIVGESGVGKSTFLQVMGAVGKPTSGELYFRDTKLNELSEEKLAQFRNRSIGFVFQFHYLLPEFTALENVMIPLRMRGTCGTEIQKHSLELLEAVGLSHRLTHRPSELSGGEQQRVAIARALVGNPELLLADEPTGNLDVNTAEHVSKLFFDVVKRGRRSMVMATHNPNIAAMADRVLRLRNGRLESANA